MIKNTIIIPAYNEEKPLSFVLEELSSIIDDSYEVILIDDGSTDKTAEVADDFGIKIIKHPVNFGKGASMMTGIEAAQGQNIIFLDADNTYPIEKIKTIVNLLKEYDMVNGARENLVNMEMFNRFGNKLFRKMFKIFYKSNINDPLSGLYGLKKECLELMQLSSYGFDIETEITIKATCMNLKIAEFPIQYNERVGETKLKPVRDGFHILKRIISFLLIFNPNYSIIIPGFFLFFFSLILFLILSLTSINFGDFHLDIHSLIFSCMMAIVGLQILTFGLITKIYVTLYKNIPTDRLVNFITKRQIWKPVFLVGVISVLAGIFLIFQIFYGWFEIGFQPIMKLNESIFALFLFIIGVQIVFSSLFISVFAKDIVNKQSKYLFFKKDFHQSK